MMMQGLIGSIKKGFVIVVSAPAGTGKTTLVRMLVNEFPEQVIQSISCTTRSPREGEIDGKDYVFLKEEAFQKRVESGEFLEYADVFDYRYGTLRGVVENQLENGRHVVLVIDTQGALILREKIKALFIFIAPPSIDTLKERLESRQTETEEVIEKRLAWAREELNQASYYDYKIVNDDLNTAYVALKSIIIAEEHRIKTK